MAAAAYKLDPSKLADLLAKARAARTIETTIPSVPSIQVQQVTQQVSIHTDRHGNLIQYNAKQQEFINLVLAGKSCILLGAAGTGKTTCMQGVISALIQSGKAGLLDGEDHKYLPASGAPGIVVTAFTRRAVSNIRRVMNTGMKENCITTHKLLEYQPVYYTVIDDEGKEKNTMCFEATRNCIRKLPSSIRIVAVEESSMMSVELFNQIVSAESSAPQYIFLGDIQQLPPVFGSAILGHKMLCLPVVELTEVYRQALESPIIRLAHRILSGKEIPASEYSSWYEEGKLKLHPWKKKLSAELALMTAAKFFTTALDAKSYDPAEDMILIPFNKAFGTDELNRHIANHIARTSNKLTYEVIAGFNKHYFSVGDKVLYDKEDAVIVCITPNPGYTGTRAQSESTQLDYWGHNHLTTPIKTEETVDENDIDFYLSQAASLTGDEERVKQASHLITVRIEESDIEYTIETASELNGMILSYALTVHKSQGSEWRKVFLVLHQSHATMIQRELLYTAVTRAREELYVICEPETFSKGITSQRIKGNTLEEKAEFFKGKLENKI
jgi:exodeoxyribonuclease V alpha subunit